MSSGDEGIKAEILVDSVVLFSKLQNRLRACQATNHGFFVTLCCCNLQLSRFLLCLLGEIKPVEANETAMQFGLLVN